MVGMEDPMVLIQTTVAGAHHQTSGTVQATMVAAAGIGRKTIAGIIGIRVVTRMVMATAMVSQ